MSRPSYLGSNLIVKGQDPVDVDIVIVHGLQGHPINTWTSESVRKTEDSKSSFWRKLASSKSTKSDGERPIFWPRDFLPEVLPNARIFTYGYEARVLELFSSASQSSLYGIARDLVADIQLQRESKDEETRPIIWIAHSLGGVVVKDALVQSHALEVKAPHLYSIYRQTKGIIYMGTPHRGSDSASLGLIAASAAQALLQDTNMNLLRSLKSGSSELERISDAFSLLPSKLNKSLLEYSFQEGKGMASALPLIGGKIVPDVSSRLDDGVGNTSSIAENHRDMCRFSKSTSRDFVRVQGVLKRFVQAATDDAMGETSQHGGRASYDDDGTIQQQPASHGGRSNIPVERPHSTFVAIPRREAGPSRSLSSGKSPHLQRQDIAISSQRSGGIRSNSSDSDMFIPKRRPVDDKFFELPLPDNRFFTGRKSHLQNIQVELGGQAQEEIDRNDPQSPNCVLLIGMGGCGKTEIALRYARDHRNDYTAVIWLDGTSRDTLDSSMARVSSNFPTALKRNLDGGLGGRSEDGSRGGSGGRRRGSPKASFSYSQSTIDLPKDLKDYQDARKPFDILPWLGKASHGWSWLLIIDNMDDPKMVNVVEDMFLMFKRGAILITTRNQKASKLGVPIQVAEMGPAEAATLLKTSLGPSAEDEDIDSSAAALVKELGYLALAIDQAAAYIKYNQLSIAEYISLFDEEEEYLLGQSAQHRYHKTKAEDDTVLKTWEISFRFIKRTHPDAAALLKFLAFLNPEDIQESMFTRFQSKRQWSRWSSSGDLETVKLVDMGLDSDFLSCLLRKTKLRSAIGMLLSLSLLRRKATTQSLSMHPLVHFWASTRMDIDERSQWIRGAVAFLSVLIPPENQLPPVDGRMKVEASSIGISTHIQTLHELSTGVSGLQNSMALLLAYGSYYAEHFTSHRMFAAAKELCVSSSNIDGIDFQHLVMLNWALAKSSSLAAPCCEDGHIPLSETLQVLKLQTKSKSNHLPGENALLLRLAFLFGYFLVRTPVKRDLFDPASQQLPPGSVNWTTVLKDSWQKAALSVIDDFVQCWVPTDTLKNPMEVEANLLRNLYVYAVSEKNCDPKPSSKHAEMELLECVPTYITLDTEPLQRIIFSALSQLAVSQDRTFDESLRSIQRLGKLFGHYNPSSSALADIANAVSKLCTRWENQQQRMACTTILKTFKEIEQEKRNRRRETADKYKTSEQAKWEMLWDAFFELWENFGKVQHRSDKRGVQLTMSTFLQTKEDDIFRRQRALDDSWVRLILKEKVQEIDSVPTVDQPSV